MNLPSNLTDIFLTLRYVAKSTIKKISCILFDYLRGQEKSFSQVGYFLTDIVWVLVFKFWSCNRPFKTFKLNANKRINITAIKGWWINNGWVDFEIDILLVILNAEHIRNLSWCLWTNFDIYLKTNTK